MPSFQNSVAVYPSPSSAGTKGITPQVVLPSPSCSCTHIADFVSMSLCPKGCGLPLITVGARWCSITKVLYFPKGLRLKDSWAEIYRGNMVTSQLAQALHPEASVYSKTHAESKQRWEAPEKAVSTTATQSSPALLLSSSIVPIITSAEHLMKSKLKVSVLRQICDILKLWNSVPGGEMLTFQETFWN